MPRRELPYNSDEELDMTPDPPLWDFDRIHSNPKMKNGRFITNKQWVGISIAAALAALCFSLEVYWLYLEIS